MDGYTGGALGTVIGVFIILILLASIASLFYLIGSLITKYDNQLAGKKKHAGVDRVITVARWALYIPIGLLSSFTFTVLLAALLFWDARLLSFLPIQVALSFVGFYVMGLCFYRVLPTQDKGRRMNLALASVFAWITLLLITNLTLFRAETFGPGFAAYLVSNISVALAMVFFLLNPGKQSWLKLGIKK